MANIFFICMDGSYDELVTFLSNPLHAFSVYLCDKDGDTPLHTCIRNDRTNFISLLIQKGASIRALGHDLETPLMTYIYSCCSLSVEIVKQLLDSNLPILFDIRENCPLVHLVETRYDDAELLQILNLFLEHTTCRADLYEQYVFKEAHIQNLSVFNFACLTCTPAVVECLLKKIVTSDVLLEYSLVYASKNARHGNEILHLLVRRQPNYTKSLKYLHEIFSNACKLGSLDMLKTLVLYFGPMLRQQLRMNLKLKKFLAFGDLMGTLEYVTTHFNIKVRVKVTDWVYIRHYCNEKDVYINSKYTIREHMSDLFLVTMITTGTTRIRDCFLAWLNPLIRNAEGLSILDVAKDPILKQKIREYSQWEPWPVNKTWWYGPYFEERARTFMLIRNRWLNNGTRVLPREICYCIIRHLASTETVWITHHNHLMLE
jgi:ankyrin repeat protein